MEISVWIRQSSEYPWREAAAGLEASGHTPCWKRSSGLDILTWNAYGPAAQAARQARSLGKKHVVMENAYLGRFRTNSHYLLERDGYNGLGRIPAHITDGGERWKRLGLQISPWRMEGGHILVCAQRGGGYSQLAMSNDWPDRILTELRAITDRPIWYRPHPGRPRLPKGAYKNVRLVSYTEPLESQFTGAHAVVVWTSFSALHAVLFGVPAFYCGPSFIGAELCQQGVAEIDFPLYSPNRAEVFHELAWHQWSVDEIKDGTAWRFILQ